MSHGLGILKGLFPLPVPLQFHEFEDVSPKDIVNFTEYPYSLLCVMFR
jgi:hypothetical protein